jgi:5-methylcytosine-specific restriction endonuclease McrA
MNYGEYLESDKWKALAAETRRLANHRCQVCYSDGQLHIHHRTYERVGNEFQSDLIALCSSCHTLFHGKHDAASVGGWALVQSLANELREAKRYKS